MSSQIDLFVKRPVEHIDKKFNEYDARQQIIERGSQNKCGKLNKRSLEIPIIHYAVTSW